MSTFNVELVWKKHVSFGDIEAKDEDEAEEKAQKMLDKNPDLTDDFMESDSEWDVEEVKE